MHRYALLLSTVAALLVAGGDKGPPTASAANDRVALNATLYLGKDAVREQLGSDLDGYFIVVRLELAPKGTEPLAVTLDDFLLRSYNDGQKSGAFSPTQIAGRAGLVIGSTYDGVIEGRQRGPRWGGIGGAPPIDPGLPGSGVGTGAGASTATVKAKKNPKEDPMLAVLRQKILPETKTDKPVSGLLYFSLDGKHKPKDIALFYNGPAGKLKLQFK